MLQLRNISKDYIAGDTIVHALKEVNICFRRNEFVSILGQSGCGKTTMLNIIGGLDHYTSGDLVINGKSTKKFKDRDWDTYRNHSIGFVFQSYNLISHQTVLSNVELALTLSGVSKSERRRRAKEALEKVGLGDQLHKKPNQMSGGQMQRVAIARALVNNPDILLADEPTGALDTETSVQIMDILKEIAKDKLVIMVTHNPELANQYSSRIIKLLDGKVIDDSMPFDGEKYDEEEVNSRPKAKKTSMSLFTALSLSLNNLLTKKARTFMTAFAGSIGIIGIALIMSLSNGVQLYIDDVQRDTLTAYPITIMQQTTSMDSMMESMSATMENTNEDMTKVYSNNLMLDVMTSLTESMKENNLVEFKRFLDKKENKIHKYVTEVQYVYNVPMYVYSSDTSKGINRVNPSTLFDAIKQQANIDYMGVEDMSLWTVLNGNKEMVSSQYQVVEGKMPEKADEIVLIVDENNQASDFLLYSIGMMDQEELLEAMKGLAKGEEQKSEKQSFTFDDILSTTYKLILPSDYYKYDEKTNTWTDKSEDALYMKDIVDNGMELKIVGIIKPTEDSNVTTTGAIGYTQELSEYLVKEINKQEIVKKQLENPDVDVFTGIEFEAEEVEITMEDVNAYVATLPEEEQARMQGYMQNMSEEEILAMFKQNMPSTTTEATYDLNVEKLGILDIDNPTAINIYAKDFETKDKISEIIADYNDDVRKAGEEDKVIEYTDYIALLMSSVTTIINAISYILIAFVAISLVVSSIMIGIITYISVLERTKEIGILRSIGASKKDISRVFNAETLIVGFVAGMIGIIITLLMLIPINAIILSLTEIAGLAKLPVEGGVGLVIISMVLTVVAGLFPAKVASKKDPVIALRTE
ncbi:MAG: ABC transporter ATP-binding protein/permease [Lachnospiraceae bacterium]|nr:ABC transporter ATP-binding protein/permease [Lachnospiraceae bacterium]